MFFLFVFLIFTSGNRGSNQSLSRVVNSTGYPRNRCHQLDCVLFHFRTSVMGEGIVSFLISEVPRRRRRPEKMKLPVARPLASVE